MQGSEDVVIVLAEDDPGHARLIEKNLHTIIANPIVRFSNGQETLDYLLREERASQQHVLLLDLNMPVMDGYQVLEHLKKDERTRRIPVIVLTTTDEPGEIQRCYNLGCNAYVVKSADCEEFTEAMHRLGLFLTVARMPQGEVISMRIPAAPCRVGLTVSKPKGWQGSEAEKGPGGRAD